MSSALEFLERAFVGDSRQVFGAWLFLRLLGVTHLVAFWSLGSQIRTLAGRDGLMPIGEQLRQLGPPSAAKVLARPTLSWIWPSDGALQAQSIAGIVLAVLLIAGVATVPVLVGLALLYLSLTYSAVRFVGYQWDMLLIESTVVALFVAPLAWLAPAPAYAPTRLGEWLLVWLVFRLMLFSGTVKLGSGDRSWRTLRALEYYYETQPLPNRLCWYAHRLPSWFHRLACGIMFAIVLGLPVLLWLPGEPRSIAAGVFVVLLSLFAITGGYGFLNLLAIALAGSLLDDRFFMAGLRWLEIAWSPEAAAPPPLWWALALLPLALLLALLSLDVVVLTLRRRALERPRWLTRLRPLRLVNHYGPYAVMLRERFEVELEGSRDGKTWAPFLFRYKPGPLARAPRHLALHHPRLDRQMWMAALSQADDNPWLLALSEQLLQGSAAAGAMLAANPFAEEAPRYVRAQRYRYRFTSGPERRASGAWWHRELVGPYFGPLKLSGGRLRSAPEALGRIEI